ncbi:hypothetical protein N7455_004591 [Penicillium solitum]|uniref:uncharacterized protein n=1 Tax=Penicillium solitum TaxID=60172 RepID=UPI0032C3DA93|nr:hypothetical protein N7455_004591 [Penicillium solitum]
MGCFQRIHEFGKKEFLPFTSDKTDPEVAIALDNITILPSQKTARIALTDVSFKVTSGSLVIVISPFGSGKTTLLKTILGELSCLSGTVSISSRKVSHCSQNPWLLNTTIKKSVTGISDHEVDDKWYKTVIYSCCLDKDIRRWPDGDQSEIGSKGLALSGGQKQRVVCNDSRTCVILDNANAPLQALARSVYSRHGIALLDDVMSALDAQTQEMIIQRLLSRDGIFRQLGTTVVLTTHNYSVVSLTSDGRVDLQMTGSDIENMDRTRQIGDLSIYYYYVRTVGPILSAVFLVGQVFSAFAENFPQVWLSKWSTAGCGQLPLYLSVYAVLALAASLLTIWCYISKIAPASIRERLMAVPQDPFTFLGTIRYNADIMGLSSDSQIISVLKQIGVWAAIESRGGLDAFLEDHPLSQGEQQLFCLARAILKRQTSNGGSTSSLDTQTDRRVQKVMREAFHDCTVFSIAHRVFSLSHLLPKRKLIVEKLDTIIDFDRIAVLDAECLVEFDTPQNLLPREGLFKQMYSGTDGQEL